MVTPEETRRPQNGFIHNYMYLDSASHILVKNLTVKILLFLISRSVIY